MGIILRFFILIFIVLVSVVLFACWRAAAAALAVFFALVAFAFTIDASNDADVV